MLTFGLESTADGRFKLPFVVPYATVATLPDIPSVTAYRGAPLFQLSTYTRGKLIEATAMKIDERMGYTASPPRTIRGGRGAYDWHRAERDERLECKSSLLHWDQIYRKKGATNNSGERGMWRVKFQNIKWDDFDVLYLCVYVPQGLFFYLYNGARRAKTLLFGAAVDVVNISRAFEDLHRKMTASCTLVGAVFF